MKKISVQDLLGAKFGTVEELAVTAKDLLSGQHFEASVTVVEKLSAKLNEFKIDMLAQLGDMVLAHEDLLKQIEELKTPKEPEKVAEATPAPAAPATDAPV